MMYAPRGFGLSEVGDVEIFSDGELLHLFHLTLPNHDVVQHVVSDDGLSWTALPHALRTSDPGACDDDQIWTMSVTKHAGTFYMVYTALARADDGMIQRTALATSSDLIHWTKDPRNPVAEADPRWYEADRSTRGWVSWRDPKPIRIGDTYYAVVCARENSGPLLRRGCAGLMTSSDLQTWTVQPPLFAPRRYWDLECPQVFQIDGQYYLTAAIMEDRSQRYWSASHFEGPYRVPADGGVLAPQGHYAGRVCRWHDLDLYLCWHKTDYDWLSPRNPSGKFVVAPLVLMRRPNGSLARRSFPGWEAYRMTALAPISWSSRSLFRSLEVAVGGESVSTAGMEVLVNDKDVQNIWFTGQLTIDGSRGGVAFRLDEAGGGYFVEVTTGSREVKLLKWLPSRRPDGRAWFTYVELQRGWLEQPFFSGDALPFHLLSVGPYVECTLGDDVVIATLSAERTSGRVGVWVESGTVRVTDARLAPMRLPQHE